MLEQDLLELSLVETIKIKGIPFDKGSVLAMEDGEAIWLNGLKADALQGVKDEHGVLLLKLLGNPTIEERDTWKSQQAWAEKFIADGDAAAKVNLERLLTAAERKALGNKAAATMAAKLMGKVAGTDTLISIAAGLRRETEKAIEAAQSLEDLHLAMTTSRAAVDAAIADVLAARAAAA